MSYEINVPSSAWSTQTVTLDGSLFRIELKYKERTERWYMTLKDNTGVDILTEKKLVDGQVITGLWDLPGVQGAIAVQRNYGTDVYPTYDTLGVGKQFSLVYLTEDEYTLLLKTEDNYNYVGRGNR